MKKFDYKKIIYEKNLFFSKYFLPGYKAGGPIKSLYNMFFVKKIKKKSLIVTGDRDLNAEPYNNILFNKILSKKNYNIIYLTKFKKTFLNFYNIIKNYNPDNILMNSFFDYYFSIKIIFINYFFFKKKMIVFTRGELLPNALKIKSFKKKLYLFFFKLLNFDKQIIFLTTSIEEKKKINSLFTFPKVHLIKMNLDSFDFAKKKDLNYKRKNFKILFASRILPNKNLFLCFEILDKVKFDFEFLIVGPIEDEQYWNKCKNYAKIKNIKYKYLGAKKNNDLMKIMKKSNCLLFPTKFESFSHIIAESLSNGLPVLTSSNTPWTKIKKNLNFYKSINISKLNNINSFLNNLNNLKNCKLNRYVKIRNRCIVDLKKYLNTSEIIKN